MSVQMTNGIPLCPKCQKPTERSGGVGTSTLVAYPARFNKDGENINPDRNALTLSYSCHECGTDYKIRGNEVDGFKYVVASPYIFAGEREEENTPHQTIKINRWHEKEANPKAFDDPYIQGIVDFKASLKEAITNEINKRDSQGSAPDRYDDGFDDGLQKVLALLETVKPKE